ncbi:MAG: 50S ribosomal protein L25/general stress protein Ctc [Parcubacteria group bacterium Gr01-1014_72]|nr:MAG: 50S ribosomal protein L25/general stress protein Ctc [Parcubacteria group bacterium Gr01-1014_72]
MATVLKAEARNMKDSPTALRHAGRIPAVYYGSKTKATSISLAGKDFEKVWRQVGETGVVILATPAGELPALIHDIDRDPVRETIRHADFYVFEEGQRIKLKVPIEFVGVAPAVKDLGGVLIKVLHELEVEAAPKDLPRSLIADISILVDFKSIVTAKEIAIPTGVVLITKPDEVVASVYEPKDEPVEEAPVDLSAIEVEKKGKEAKEGEEGVLDSDAKEAKGAPPAKGEKK